MRGKGGLGEEAKVGLGEISGYRPHILKSQKQDAWSRENSNTPAFKDRGRSARSPQERGRKTSWAWGQKAPAVGGGREGMLPVKVEGDSRSMRGTRCNPRPEGS